MDPSELPPEQKITQFTLAQGDVEKPTQLEYANTRQKVYKTRMKKTKEVVAYHSLNLDKSEEEHLKNKDMNSGTLLNRWLILIDIPKHPVIEKVIGFFLAPPVLVTEYLPRTYASILSSEAGDPNWTPTAKSKFLFGVAAGMMHVHGPNGKHSITHRLLSSKSVFLDKDYQPRITDFSFAKADAQGMVSNIVSADSDGFYMSPEVHDNLPFTPKIDVYSFGMLVYTLTTDEEPSFEGNNNMLAVVEKLKQGTRPPIADDVSPYLKNLITRCWSNSPEERPEFAEIVHSLLQLQEPPFPDTNVVEYLAYRDDVFSKTTIAPRFKNLFGIIDPEKLAIFQDHLAKAQAGDTNEMVQVGLALDHGEGCVADPKTALQWYLKAAELGNSFGMLDAATRLQKSPNPEDQNHAIQLFLQAANASQPFAYTFVASYYEGQQNFGEALKFYNAMANSDDACNQNGAWECQYASALLRICSNDPNAVKEAERLFSKNFERVPAAAADLSKIYFNSGRVEDGIKVLKQAANKRDPLASFKLAQLFEKGMGSQIPKNMVEALKWYETAIRYGDVHSRACAAKIYKEGYPPADPEKGQEDIDLTKSDVIPVDLERAAYLYEEAADMGDKLAMNNFGMMLYNGQGVEKNWSEAVSYLKEAADRGVRASMLTLGDIYSQGDGDKLKPDIPLARLYYQKAAEKGSEKAAEKLAKLPPQ